MKKLVIVVFAILLASCTQTKIAYIDVEVIMKDYKATKALEDKLKAKQEIMAKELDSLQGPFQLKVQKYYQEAQRMSAQKRAETEQALQQEQQFLQGKQQQASQELQKENQENSEAITKKVDSFVAEYAKTKGYKLILGTSGKGTVMYGDETLNVTKDILDILNEDFSKE
ncbi:OmpH family outer membrane protein [Lutibacter sp. B1]|uniref:OmpH family outer membrane protein n=1 Tax=Lutibacter sp. B1 TaxID=2725996 RepID=UPI0014575F4D|nr:OmpH family outer membrane protein [Lutibacter sp. B1]NLP59070.1 OmpH family outer membrane protein [Lutibacter sp. B1]